VVVAARQPAACRPTSLASPKPHDPLPFLLSAAADGSKPPDAYCPPLLLPGPAVATGRDRRRRGSVRQRHSRAAGRRDRAARLYPIRAPATGAREQERNRAAASCSDGGDRQRSSA